MTAIRYPMPPLHGEARSVALLELGPNAHLCLERREEHGGRARSPTPAVKVGSYCTSNPNACVTPDGGAIPDVGSKPLGAGRWGHLDLFGSMRDYGLDIWTPMPAACTDCVQTDTGASTTHAAVGGSWADGNTTWPSIYNAGPTTSVNPRTPAGGFRCAHDI